MSNDFIYGGLDMKTDKTITLALTGGGSGGHILPLISLLQTIDKNGHYRQQIDNIYWFGEKKGMEANFFTQYQDAWRHICPVFLSIVAGKWRRETIVISRLKNLRDMFLFPLGVLQSLWYIWIKDIDVVFCKGGYVSLPVVIAAWLLRKSIYVHDSDTRPGLTNRIASRFATKNFSGFPETLPGSHCVGQILSDGLLQKLSSDPYHISSQKRMILVAGGSLGAKKLYNAVLRARQQDPSLQQDCVFVFINGRHLVDYSLVDENVILTDLITDQAVMGWLYRRADCAIVRGGTTTLAECKLFGLPLIIVPLPVTHDQSLNADYYVQNYGDIKLCQNDVHFVDRIVQSLIQLPLKTMIYHEGLVRKQIAYAKSVILDTLIVSHSHHKDIIL